MTTHSWSRKLFAARKLHTTRKAPARVRPSVETLEDRYAPAVIPVTTLADVVNPNDGLTSLREAVLQANAIPGADTITFVPGLTGTITLGLGQLTLSSEVTIAGPGAALLAVSGNNAGRVFEIRSSSNAAIAGLTIRNGRVTGVPSTNIGGGILNYGTLTLTHSTVSDNQAIGGGSGGNLGGGIVNGGTMTMTHSTISGNQATGYGGGVFNAGRLTLTDSTVSGNRVGGLGVIGGRSGGGISNTGSTATLTLTNSTVSGNQAHGNGGGIASGGTLTLTNSTLTQNRADSDGVDGGVGGGFSLGGGTATVRNTIVAGNFSGTGTLANDIQTYGGSVNTAGSFNNLIGTGGAGGLVNGVNGNQVGVANPGLGPLANNGGPTQTHALLPGSPAINAGDPAAGTTLGFPKWDQRGPGFSRVFGGRLDIGAFEVQGGREPDSSFSGGRAERAAAAPLPSTGRSGPGLMPTRSVAATLPPAAKDSAATLLLAEGQNRAAGGVDHRDAGDDQRLRLGLLLGLSE